MAQDRPGTWVHLCSYSGLHESMPIIKSCQACGAVSEPERIRVSLEVLKAQADTLGDALLKLGRDAMAMSKSLESFIQALEESRTD